MLSKKNLKLENERDFMDGKSESFITLRLNDPEQ